MYDQRCTQKYTGRRMSIARSRGSVCSMGLDPLRHRWVRVGAQVAVLEVIVILGTLFAARFHPNSRPVDGIAIGLAVIAAGTIGVSWRGAAKGVGGALASVLYLHLRWHRSGAVAPPPRGCLL